MPSSRVPLTRSQIMSRVRGRDTRPEILVRRALRERGIGYRLQARDLPGSPDVVMRGRGLAIFVHGCFWHRHEGCRLCSTPKSNVEFWSAKFVRNVERDARDLQRLQDAGWNVVVVWECETRSTAGMGDAMDRIVSLAGQGTRIRRLPRPSR